MVSIRMDRKSVIREKLRTSALQHILTKGYENVTMDELASLGGVSRRTYFRYFETKEDVLVGLIHGRGEMIAEEILLRPANESSFTALENAIITVAEKSFHFSKVEGQKILHTIWNQDELKSRYFEHKHLWIPMVTKALIERGESRSLALMITSTGLMILDLALESRAKDQKNSLVTILKKKFEEFAEFKV